MSNATSVYGPPDLLRRLKTHKSAVLAILAGNPPKPPTTPPAVSDKANAANWRSIRDADRRYVLGARTPPPPCLSCGGRYRHGTECEEVRAATVSKAEPLTHGRSIAGRDAIARRRRLLV